MSKRRSRRRQPRPTASAASRCEPVWSVGAVRSFTCKTPLHTQAEDKNDSKTKMKGKNRPSKRHRKKQTNVIEEKRPEVQKRLREEVRPRCS